MVDWMIGIVAAYLGGSFPTGVLVGRVHGVDVKTRGSESPGASNILRLAGVKAGLITLLVDVGKGYLAVYLATRHGFTSPAWFGVAAVIGHCFPPYPDMRYKGGKGVATTLGVGLAVCPLATAMALAVFVFAVGLTRYISLGSLAGMFWLTAIMTIWEPPLPRITIFAFWALTLIVIDRHSENIKRLLAGKERKIGERE